MDIKEQLAKTFSNNLKKYMKIANKNQVDIKTEFNISSSTASDWTTGKKYPRIDKIYALAKFLDVEMFQLIEDEQISKTLISSQNLPIYENNKDNHQFQIQENAARYGTFPIDSWEDCFAFVVSDDSMTPEITKGDIAVVRKQENFTPGKYVLALIDERACIRLYDKQNDLFILQPLQNQKHDTIRLKKDAFDKHIKIIAEVIELRRHY